MGRDALRYLIGIDMGTTNVKALLFDEQGNTAGEARCPSPITLLPDGGGVFDPEELWRLCCRLLTELLDAAPAEARSRLAGLAVTGMGEAGVPLDAAGRPLYPVIAWFDPRTEQYPAWWRDTFGEDRLYAVTGLKNQHIFTANKLLWLKEHEPQVFGEMRRWHCIPDYIAFRLTGASAMDLSLATRTLLLDAASGTWSRELLAHAGIPADILPPAVPSGTKVGEVTAAAAACCGLPAGTPVFAGGHDHICGALAAGAVEPGIVLDSSGTCEEVLVSSETLSGTRPLSAQGFNAGYHTAPGRFYVSGGIPASGASVDWFRREFPAKEGGASCPGANGVLFLPHLRGGSSPERDAVSKGAFVGLQARHTHADLRQAVYEGVAFELRRSVEQLLQGGRPRRVVSIGGGTKNAAWLQIKADVLGTEIEVPAVQECTAFGAALLAGIGAGVYADAADALRRTWRLGQRVAPRAGTRQLYDALYGVYCRLYGTLRPANERLESIHMQGGHHETDEGHHCH